MARNAKSQRSVRTSATRVATSRAATEEPAAEEVAHQISQPLAAIVSLARGCQLRARKQTLGPEELDRALEDIAQEALRAGTMLRTLRATFTEQTS